jgi:uncharacterized phage protein gp47/JayE
MSSRLLDNKPVLRRSFLGVLARVFAGAVHMVYGLLQWMSQQITPDTAEAEYLERFADIWGITRIAANYGTGLVTCSGTDGAVIPAGTKLARADGVEYQTTSAGTISMGSVVIAIKSVVAGSDANAVTDTAVALVSPITGVQQAAAILGDITNGAAGENDESLRARVLQRIRNVPQGGAAIDYERWALAADSRVYRVFVLPAYAGLGTVGVTFISTEGNHIPDAALVAVVRTYINARKPVAALTFIAGQELIFAPTPVTVDFTIKLSPNTAAVQAAVTAELTALLLRDGAPGQNLLLSHINEAISMAAGENDHELVAPAANAAIASNQFPVLGTVTYQAL